MFWEQAFEVEARILETTVISSNDEDLEDSSKEGIHATRDVLDLIYARWRDSSLVSGGMVEAGLKYASWLVRVAEDGVMASRVIQNVLAACDHGRGSARAVGEREEVERRWGDILSEIELDRAGVVPPSTEETIGRDDRMEIDIEIEVDEHPTD